MTGLFHLIEDHQIVLRLKGVYRQVKLYRRNGHVYAGYGSGYVLLFRSGGTSQPDTNWEGTLDRRYFEVDGFYYLWRDEVQ